MPGSLLSSSLLSALPQLAQADPLDSTFQPIIDMNAADYPSNVWVTGPLAKVRQDSGSPGNVKWATVYGVQNEFQGFQIHINANAGAISNYSVTMSDLVNSQTGTRISASSTDIVVYRIVYVQVVTVTATGASYFNSPGWYPDVLIPAVDPYYHQTTNAFPYTIASGNNQSVWVDIHIPPSAPSGYYSGTATLKTGSTVIATLPVVYGVWQWPASAGGQMPSTPSIPYIAGFGYGTVCPGFFGGSGATNCGQYPGRGEAIRIWVSRWLQMDGTLMMMDPPPKRGRQQQYLPRYRQLRHLLRSIMGRSLTASIPRHCHRTIL